MLCSNCKKKEANFYYKQITNNQIKEVSLCSDCASALGYLDHYHEPFDFGNILNEFLSFGLLGHKAIGNYVCESCKTDYSNFKSTGLVGCSDCYDRFSSVIDSIIPSIQAGNVHKGKISGADKEKIMFNKKLGELKESLQRAVLDERYEDAAKIRDQIKELSGGEAGE